MEIIEFIVEIQRIIQANSKYHSQVISIKSWFLNYLSPDVINMVKDILSETGKDEDLKVKTAIVDAEVVAYDVQNKVILPFQVLSTRKRKVCLY